MEVTQEVRLQPYIPPNENNDDLFQIGNYLIEDVRRKASESFISDDKFIKSQEFRLFMYKWKGKEIAKGLQEIPNE